MPLKIIAPLSRRCWPAEEYSLQDRIETICWPKVATTQNRPAALNRIEYVPNMPLPSVRAARVIRTKFRIVVAALSTNTQAMPRSAAFLRSRTRLPSTLLNFTSTNLGQLPGAATHAYPNDAPPRDRFTPFAAAMDGRKMRTAIEVKNAAINLHRQPRCQLHGTGTSPAEPMSRTMAPAAMRLVGLSYRATPPWAGCLFHRSVQAGRSDSRCEAFVPATAVRAERCA